MFARFAGVQTQNLLSKFDRPLVLTRCRFQSAEKPQHKGIIGIQLVGAACISDVRGRRDDKTAKIERRTN
jgi:hypothetical protein